MRTIAAVAVLLLFTACQAPPPAEMTEAEIAQIEAEVLQMAEAWLDAWEDVETDCETAIELMHPDHMVHFSRGSRVDRAGWIDWCNRTTGNRAGYSGTWTSTEVRVLSPDAAFFVGTNSSTFESVSGSVTHYPTAAQAVLVERTATGWGITSFSNFNGPAEETEEG